jgi:proteasome assembly chaperone (PAC2) family protein
MMMISDWTSGMDKMAPLSTPFTWTCIPELRNPYLVVGFHGWSNAGSVSSDTLQYLKESLQPYVVATVSDEGFVNYSADRPVARIVAGTIQEIEPMEGQFLAWNNADGDRDLVLFLGKEPHFNWIAYSRIFLELMHKLNVGRLYTIGGVQDTISHSSPVLVTMVGSFPHVTSEYTAADENIRAADYHGPISIHSYLLKSCTDAGIEALSLWGHVPAYLQRSPRLVAKMVTILNEAVGMECPVDGLTQKAIELDRKIDEALGRDPGLKQFVETIEQKEDGETSSGDDKIIRLNQFLRRDKKDPET